MSPLNFRSSRDPHQTFSTKSKEHFAGNEETQEGYNAGRRTPGAALMSLFPPQAQEPWRWYQTAARQPQCNSTHTHTPDGSETDFQHLHRSKEVLPRVWSSRPAAQQPTHSWVIWRQSVSKPQRAEWKTDLKFRRDQLDRIRALHPWRMRSTFQESIWDAAKRIKHRKDRNARFNHGKHRAARMLWQITPSVQQQERRTLHPVTPGKQVDLLTWFPDVEKLEATERSIHAGWNTSCGFLISKQVSGGHPVEGLLMVVFVSARVGSYLRSEFGLAFSDFFHFNYI